MTTPEGERLRELIDELIQILGDDLEECCEVVCWLGEDQAHMLRRFLVAALWIPEDAAIQLRNTLRWRKEEGILRMRTCSASEVLGDVKEDDILEALPMMVKLGLEDKTGRQVSLYHIGKADIKRLYELVSTKTLQRYLIWRFERLTIVLGRRVEKKLPDRASVVMDLDGFNFVRDFTSDAKSLLSVLMKTTSLYFPEMMGKMVIINSGWLFKGIWTMISPWIRPYSRAKISVLGRNCEAEMRDIYDESCITQLGEVGRKNLDFSGLQALVGAT